MKTTRRLLGLLFAALAAVLLLVLPAGAEEAQDGAFTAAQEGSFTAEQDDYYAGSLTTPRNLKAVPYGAGGIRLSWTAVSGADHYYVFRYNFNTEEWDYVGTAYKAAYYEGGLAAGTTYYYLIQAASVYDDYTSDFSGYVSATVEAGAPVAPRNVQAAVYGSSGIRLTWTASAGATQYNVYRYNGAKQEYVYIGTAYKAAYYDGNCVPGVTYYYKIKAVCKANGSTYVSGFSAAASRRFDGTPAAPKNVKAAVYNSTGLRLTWTASPGATKYYVYRYNGTKKDYVYKGTAYKAAYYDGTCAPGTTYYYKIRAVYATSEKTYVSGYSAAANKLFMGKPAVPKNLNAVVYNTSGIRLSWTASPGATHYYVYRYNGTQKDYVYIGTAYKAAYYDGGRVPGTTYYYKVRAVYKTSAATYISGLSAAASRMFAAPPIAPRNMKAVAYGNSAIRLTWTASPGATQYLVLWYDNSSGEYNGIGITSGTSFIDYDCPAVVNYYTVVAVLVDGDDLYFSDSSAVVYAVPRSKAGTSTAEGMGQSGFPYISYNTPSHAGVVVRSGPSSSYEKLDLIPEGTAVSPTGYRENGYSKVVVDPYGHGYYGWVLTKYIVYP